MDRMYKYVVKSTNKCNAGRYSKIEVDFSTNPTPNSGITIGWNGVNRTYTFVATPEGANANSLNPPTTTKCQIGADAAETVYNLISTIYSNPHDVSLGKDTTISAVASGSKLVLYGNAKLGGSISASSLPAGATTSNAVAGQAASSEPGGPFSGFVTTSTTPTVLVRDPDADGYNAGPPVNQLKTVTINTPANTFVPLQVWGINTVNATFYK